MDCFSKNPLLWTVLVKIRYYGLFKYKSVIMDCFNINPVIMDCFNINPLL